MSDQTLALYFAPCAHTNTVTFVRNHSVKVPWCVHRQFLKTCWPSEQTVAALTRSDPGDVCNSRTVPFHLWNLWRCEMSWVHARLCGFLKLRPRRTCKVMSTTMVVTISSLVTRKWSREFAWALHHCFQLYWTAWCGGRDRRKKADTQRHDVHNLSKVVRQCRIDPDRYCMIFCRIASLRHFRHAL